MTSGTPPVAPPPVETPNTPAKAPTPGIKEKTKETKKEIKDDLSGKTPHPDLARDKEERERQLGKNPTPKTVVEKLGFIVQKDSGEVTYEDVMKELKEGPNKSEEFHKRLKEHVKTTDQPKAPEKKPAQQIEDKKKELNKPDEKKPEDVKKIEDTKKPDISPVKEEETLSEEPENKKKPKKSKKESKGKRGFRKGLGKVASRPFRKGRQAGKRTVKTAVKTVKTAGRIVRAPVSLPSHMLGYNSVSKGSQARWKKFGKIRGKGSK